MSPKVLWQNLSRSILGGIRYVRLNFRKNVKVLSGYARHQIIQNLPIAPSRLALRSER